MAKLKYYLSSRELLLLYNSFVLPYINYCAVVWGYNYVHRTHRIVKLQKRALRIIDKKPYLFPSNELFVKYKLLKLPELVTEQSIVILLAHLNGKLPKKNSDLFHLNEPLNTRISEHFFVPFTRNNFRLFSIAIATPRAWNDVVCKLFNSLDTVPRNKNILKKSIRDYLLRKYE